VVTAPNSNNSNNAAAAMTPAPAGVMGTFNPMAWFPNNNNNNNNNIGPTGTLAPATPQPQASSNQANV
jgi:hypothetical protein